MQKCWIKKINKRNNEPLEMFKSVRASRDRPGFSVYLCVIKLGLKGMMCRS